jgi:hypothetical protein
VTFKYNRNASIIYQNNQKNNSGATTATWFLCINYITKRTQDRVLWSEALNDKQKPSCEYVIQGLWQ